MLDMAFSNGHPNIVWLLLEHGVEVSMKGGKYSTVLHAASLRGNKNIVHLIIEKGAEANITNALQAALSNRHHTIITLLGAYCKVYQNNTEFSSILLFVFQCNFSPVISY